MLVHACWCVINRWNFPKVDFLCQARMTSRNITMHRICANFVYLSMFHQSRARSHVYLVMLMRA